MRIIKTKKGLALLAVLVVAAVAAIGGYAYFTTTGSGTGSAGVGQDTPLTITQKNAVSGLVPGGPSKTVDYTIANAAGNGDQYVGLVTVSIGTITQAQGATGNCTAADFSVSQPSVAPGVINDGASFDSSTVVGASASVSMVETNAVQDGCKGATVALTFSA